VSLLTQALDYVSRSNPSGLEIYEHRQSRVLASHPVPEVEQTTGGSPGNFHYPFLDGDNERAIATLEIVAAGNQCFPYFRRDESVIDKKLLPLRQSQLFTVLDFGFK
jgi:hypothetical protein